jgi:hypothetical protein
MMLADPSFVSTLFAMVLKLLVCLFGLALIDFSLCYRARGRYYWLHGLWNMVMTICVLPDVLVTLKFPHDVMDHPAISHWPLIMVEALHVWHCIAYSDLRSDEYFHHFVFAFPLWVVAGVWDWGSLTNYVIFFMSGLGGVRFFSFAMVKTNWISKLECKRCVKLISVWLRIPGLISAAVIIYISIMNGTGHQVPVPLKVIGLVLSVTNGLHYGELVIASCAIHEAELKRSTTQISSTEVQKSAHK